MGLFNGIFIAESPVASKHNIALNFTTMDHPTCSTMQNQPRPVQLPTELLLEILESAYYDERTLEPDYEVLRISSLVCSEWREAAQRLLFRNVVLRSQRSYESFVDAVDQDSARGDALAQSVVRLRVTVALAQPDGVTMDDFVHALSLVPNLYELDLSLFGTGTRSASSTLGQVDPADLNRYFPALPAPLMSALKLARPRSLTALTLSNWSHNTKLTTQLLALLSSRSSRESSAAGPLRFLTLRGTSAPSAVSTRSGIKFSSDLASLRLSFQHGPSNAFVSWLLGSTTALSTLELEREAPPPLLEHIMHLQPNLASLSIPSCTPHIAPILADSAQHLRELQLEDAWVSPAAFRAVPVDELEHLALGIGRETPLRIAMEVIVSAPKLRAVTVMMWEAQPNPFVEEIKAAAERRGIVWRQVKDVRLFRSALRADPLPTETYPRTKDAQNLQRMHSAALAIVSSLEDDIDFTDSEGCFSGYTSRGTSPSRSLVHSRHSSVETKPSHFSVASTSL